MIFTLQDRKGQLYRANFDAIKQLCLAWAHAAGKFRSCSLKKTRSGNFYGKEFAHVAFNAAAFRSYKTSEAQRMFSNQYFDPMLRGVRDYRDLIGKLVDLRENTARKSRIVFQHFEAADRENRVSLRALERNVKNAKLVRDISATALVIGASPVAAAGGFGAGVATLSTGALLKGNAVYQDTGNVGMATVEVACEMTFGMVAVGSAATTTAELIKAGTAASKGGGGMLMMLFVEVPAEGAKTAVGGGSLSDAIAASVTKASFGMIDLPGKIEDWSIPVIGKLFANVSADKATGVIRDEAHQKIKQYSGSNVNKLNAKGAMKKSPGVFINSRQSHRKFVVTNCICKV